MQITHCLGTGDMQIGSLPPTPAPCGGGRAEVGGSPLLGGGELLVLNITYYQDGF